MKGRYLILPVEGSEGIEFLSDPPVGRPIYRPGAVVELDDAVHDIAGLMARGQVKPVDEPAAPIGEED